ncbi:MAG: HepT-like ribonuclease domain-containing protein [Methylovirgula sp.]
MAAPSLIPRLTDIIESIERIRLVLGEMPLDSFETDWQRQWLVERGVEIISEASRHLTDDLKARHPEIPWQKVVGIGNVLRHDYESVAAPILWKLARDDLTALEQVCRTELDAAKQRERR